MSWAGNLIKQARLQAGLSQRELARRAGTSQATMSAYESGRKSPSLETLTRIVRAANQDLRIRVVEHDEHDDVMAAYEASLPKRTVARHRARELELLNRARKRRGLDPISAEEVGVAAVDDIVAMKRAAGREKDAAHLAILLEQLGREEGRS